MTREEAKKLLPVIEAWIQGREVQVKEASNPGAWKTYTPTWHREFDQPGHEWRIKPTPREWWICMGCYSVKPGAVTASKCCLVKDPIHVREVLDEGGAP